MKKVILLSLALLFTAVMQAPAETRLVPGDYQTIQQAILASNDGDVVVVSAGTYLENINFLGKNIVVTSTDPNDSEIVAATIIDGSGQGSVVTFENGETSEAVLTGFTITGGYGTVNSLFGEEIVWGAGIFCTNASPTIKGNIITGNIGAFEMPEDNPDMWKLCYGGGISCLQSGATITNNIIKDNSGYAGAGIMTYPFIDPTNGDGSLVHPMISNNLIYDNSAYIGGGVILLYTGKLINNTIMSNDSSLSPPGGGIGLAGNVYTASEPELGQCVILNNIICNAKSGGGIFSDVFGEDLIAFNDVWNNAPGNYLSQDPQTGEQVYDGPVDRTGLSGNISQDPLFGDNYHIGADSPCCEAGDPDYIPYPWQRDIDGEYAVMGARVDIGADEVTANARPVADAGDDQFFDTIVAYVSLDGTGSYDPDAGDVISYEWDQISGQSVDILQPETPEPNFVPTVEDVYVFELTVFDGNNTSVPDRVMIVVGNRAPIADAGDDQAFEPGQQAILDGSRSYDLDEGDILSYDWSQISGPSVELLDPNTQAPRFTPNTIGEYVFELIVNDGTDFSLPDTVTVTCRIGSEPDAYGYRWLDSDSPWGPKYRWIEIQDTGTGISGLEYSFEESVGPFPLGFNFNFYGNTYNQFYVQSNGLISFDSVPIIYGNQLIPTADGYENIIAWMWTYMYPTDDSKIYYQHFGDYTVVQFVDYEIGWGGSVNAEVKIYESGKIVIQYKDFTDDAYLYSYTIGIENADGTIGTQAAFNDSYYLHDELAIEFALGPPEGPVAYAGPDQHVAEIQMITLDGSGSFVYDPCDVVLMYEWDQLSGPAVELNDPTSMHPTFIPEFKGEYVFELVVIDGENMSEPDEVLILVGNQPPVAEAGPNRVLQAPSYINLDGTGSYDPDHMDELTYAWTQLEGPEVVLRDADTATPYFNCNEEGIYAFELVVSDGFVDSEPSVVHVTTVTVTMNQYGLNAGFETSDYFYYPDVSGPTVVYSVGTFDNYRWSIRSKNLETGVVDEEFFGNGINTQPKIDGDILAWAGGPTNPVTIGTECISVFVRNIATGTQQTLREHSDTESYSHPAVSANKVVWLEHLNLNRYNQNNWRNTPYNICGADIVDLNNPVYFTIAENVGRRDPYPYDNYNEDFDDVIDISEDIVVWEAEGDIYGADISDIDDIRTFTICSDAARQYDPAISGNFVVWTDERNDDGDIYAADISDIENIRELTIIRSPNTQQRPAIDSGLIVYIDGDNYGQIRACCLTKQSGVMDIELSGYPYGMYPAIDGQTIVWQTGTYGQVEGISLEFACSAIDGPVENLTTGKSYDYIQHAIVSASAGDRIVVSEGIYYEDINLKSKSLAISSTNPDDPAVVAATIIDGSSRAVTLLSSENTKCVLSGFTITGGSRGIYCSGGKSPSMNNYNTVANCNITGNTGAGVELYSGGNPIFTNCSISANAGAGFEMHLRRSGRFTYSNYPKINNCIIAANHRHGISGGIPKITNCNIVGNLQGGIDDSRPLITNSIIYYNGDGPDTAQIANSVATVTYSDVQGSWPGVGNIDADPCFVTPCYWADAGDPNAGAEPGGLDIIWIDGDYHLKSEAGHWDSGSETWVQDDLGSPCIDAGDPDSCIGFEPNPNGSVINIGAYGGTAQAGLSPSGVSCISADHPDYDEWVAVGEPVCWCYRRQCHGDADCKSQSTQKYWVSTDDLDILIAAWCKPYSEIEGVKVSGLDLVCADFDHKAQGKNKQRVSVNDLDILIASWNIADKPDPDCP